MFSYLNNAKSEVNSDGEGFAKWDIISNSKNLYSENSFSGIKGRQSQTVLFKPCLGLLKQIKIIPLRYAPLTRKSELVNDSTDVILSTLDDSGSGIFKSDNTNLTWEIQNAQV